MGGGVGFGIMRGSITISHAIFNATSHFPIGTRIVTTIGVFSFLAGGTMTATLLASNLAPNVPYNINVTNIIVPSANGTGNEPGYGNDVGGQVGGPGAGSGFGSNINSSNQMGNNDLNSINMNDIIDDNLISIDINNSIL